MNEHEKLRLMRFATSAASSKYSIGGIKKSGGHVPRPVTLPRVKCLDVPDEQADGDR